MPLSRATLERQINQAKSELASWVKALTEQGLERAAFRRNPKWRNLNANINQIQRRLNRVTEIEANNAEVEKRKTEKASA